MNMHHSSVHQRRSLLIAVILLWFFGITMPTSAQTEACGDIVTPVNFYFEGSEEDRRAIVDCTNPFAKTANIENFYLGEELVQDQGIVYSIDPIKYYGIPGVEYRYINRDMFFYKHTTSDYERINIKYETPPRQDYYEIIARLIPGNTARIDFYTDVLSADNPRSYLYTEIEEGVFDHQQKTLDPFTGETVEDVYFSLSELVEEQIVYPRTPLGPGTYTAVWVVSGGGGGGVEVSIHPWLRWFIPVAYASTIDIRTITFTIATPLPEPTGASSVLFLPGIMGSHLYEATNNCFGFGERQNWFSITDCNQERLFLDENGDSINDIYTRIEDAGVVADVAYGAFDSLYANFMESLNELEGEIIKDFVPFPYDWRLRLDHQLQTVKDDQNKVRYVPDLPYQEGLLYQTIKEMASSSHSGRVTIVAHSNGGLVVKTLMQKLQSTNDPLVSKIDNIILIGSPQVGTPDAIVGVLHGTEIANGWAVSQEMARNLLNNAPFGYHLLPNQHYFEGQGSSVQTPVIVFDGGTSTADFRSQYGEDINSFNELRSFMGSASSRQKPESHDLYTPEIANDNLLQYAEEIGDTLASWAPASTTKIYQLAGTGMWTPKTLRYFTGEVCIKHNQIIGTCAAYGPQLQHSIYFTRDGDGTVVIPSASAMSESDQVERWWLDLDKHAKQVNTNVHRNMMEVAAVASFVSAIAQRDAIVDTTYITRGKPDLSDEHSLIYHLHSPLDMYVTSDQGVLSSTTNSIPGAMYRRFGEVQYVILPANISSPVLHLVGYSSGSFTLISETWDGSTQQVINDYRAIPSATSTYVTLAITATTTLQVDYDGDGTIDAIVSPEQDVLQAAPPVLSVVTQVNKTRDRSQATRVQPPIPEGQVAGMSTTSELVRIEQMVRLLQQIMVLLVKLKSYESE